MKKNENLADMNLSKIEEQIKLFGEDQPWNHCIKLASNLWTSSPKQSSHGKNLVKLKRIKKILPAKILKGANVLDIGCNEGFFSFEFAKLGAKNVKGIDADEFRINKANFVNEILEIPNVRFEKANVYDELSKEVKYDFVLCLGFLHRIPSPYDFLSLIHEKANSILFEWKSPPHEFPHSRNLYWDGVNKTDNKYSKAYYRISINSLIEMMKEFGFSNFKVMDDTVKNRPILLASRDKRANVTIITNRGFLITKLFKRFFSDLKRLLSSFYD